MTVEEAISLLRSNADKVDDLVIVYHSKHGGPHHDGFYAVIHTPMEAHTMKGLLMEAATASNEAYESMEAFMASAPESKAH